MCVYLYMHNKYTQYTHILCKQKQGQDHGYDFQGMHEFKLSLAWMQW